MDTQAHLTLSLIRRQALKDSLWCLSVALVACGMALASWWLAVVFLVPLVVYLVKACRGWWVFIKHRGALLGVLGLLLVGCGGSGVTESAPKGQAEPEVTRQAQPPSSAIWLDGLREMIEGTKGRALEITLRSGPLVDAVSAVMSDAQTIKATKTDGSVVLIPLGDVAQMVTKGALRE